jgi:hypothetical protein
MYNPIIARLKQQNKSPVQSKDSLVNFLSKNPDAKHPKIPTRGIAMLRKLT